MGATLHYTSSIYLPIKKDTKTSLITFTSPHSLIHCNLHNLGCLWVCKFSLSTNKILATLVQLPLVIIMVHALSFWWHLIWNMFSHCSFFSSPLGYIPRTFLVTNKSPCMKSSTSTLEQSSNSSISSSLELALSTLSFSNTIIVHFLGHCEVICPKPWHLRHFTTWFSWSFSFSFFFRCNSQLLRFFIFFHLRHSFIVLSIRFPWRTKA